MYGDFTKNWFFFERGVLMRRHKERRPSFVAAATMDVVLISTSIK